MQLRADRYVLDGGMETDLIFHRGWDLPDFASFPLLDSERGRAELTSYFDDYATIAKRDGSGFLVETPTWRANPDHAAVVGYDGDAVVRITRDAVDFARFIAARHRDELEDVQVGFVIGPRADGYVSEAPTDPDAAEAYHGPQLAAAAEAGADYAVAYTLTDPGEAIGVVRAARASGLPVAISFTVETDGLLPSGDTLAAAIARVDAAASPDHFLVNCAHPTHIAEGLAAGGDWAQRIFGIRPNASRLSHTELDAATELDEGDLDELAGSHRSIVGSLPNLRLLGGCCGTDARHVAALCGVGAGG